MTEPAILYARYSPRPEETADHCESIAVQMTCCVVYCEINGLEPAYFLTDRLVSARKLPLKKRPAGKLLMKLLDKGRARHVVCQKLDRIFRNQVDGLVTLERWHKQGISLHLADQGGCTINCGTATGKMLAGILLNFAEFEPSLTAERTSGGMKHRQSNGQRMSRYAPFGYMVDPSDPSRLVPNPEELAVCDRIRQWRDAGWSLRSIAAALNESGAPCRGRQWHHTTVRALLRRFSQG